MGQMQTAPFAQFAAKLADFHHTARNVLGDFCNIAVEKKPKFLTNVVPCMIRCPSHQPELNVILQKRPVVDPSRRVIVCELASKVVDVGLDRARKGGIRALHARDLVPRSIRVGGKHVQGCFTF